MNNVILDLIDNPTMANGMCDRHFEEQMNDIHQAWTGMVRDDLTYYPKTTIFNDISNGTFFYEMVDEPKVGELGHCMKFTGDHLDIRTLYIKTSASTWENYLTGDKFETLMPMHKEIVVMKDYEDLAIAKTKFNIYKYQDYVYLISEDKDIQHYFIDGYYIYDIRHEDNDICMPATFEPRGIMVNRFATIIMNKPFQPLHDVKGSDKYVDYNDCFATCINSMTLAEFFAAYPPEKLEKK